MTAPAFLEHAGTLESDETWAEGLHLVTGDIYVDGTTLTFEPGATISFKQGTALHVGLRSSTSGGTLIANGTANKPITFTSSATSKTPGDWNYIGFYEYASSISSMKHCVVEYGGGYSDTYGEIYVSKSSVTIEHSTIRNSETFGISLVDGGFFQSFTGNTVMDNGSSAITIYGNYAHTIGEGNTITSDKGVLVKGDDIDEADATWLMQNIPYIVNGTVYLESTTGAKLTIEAGTTVKFTEGSELYVGLRSGKFGILVADGDSENKITFSSGAPAGFETAGDWDGLWFYDGTGSGTLLDNCVISFGGGYSANSGNLNIKNDAAGIPEISNSLIENSGAWGIYLDNGAVPTLTNITYSNNISGDKNL